VINYKTKQIIVKNISNSSSFIEADGEIIGINSFNISIMPNAIQFLIP
jgi:diacylglycerol kinase family enzyme